MKKFPELFKKQKRTKNALREQNASQSALETDSDFDDDPQGHVGDSN